MTSTDYLNELRRALSQDLKLAWELDGILHRTQQLNIDFRRSPRRLLYARASRLASRLNDRRTQVRMIDLSVVNSPGLMVEIATLDDLVLNRAYVTVVRFHRAAMTSLLDAERVPELTVQDVVHQLEHAIGMVTWIAGIFAEAERKFARPLWVSQRLANLAARLLPWEQRDRYLNEYLSELDELAQDDSLSRRAQLRHALRLLVRTPALRLALRTPAHEKRLPMTTESR